MPAFRATPALAARLPFYYGWINLALASVAMLATLPGRSVGLGLITEPMLADLAMDRVAYGTLTFWATVIGATFAVAVGPLIDRWGVRAVSTGVIALLAAAVVLMGNITAAGLLFLLLLILVRGLGQSALSVVSLTIVGKWFVARLATAMGIFAVTIGIGFAAVIVLMGGQVAEVGWRSAWTGLGWAVAVAGVLCVALVRRSPEACGLEPDSGGGERPDTGLSGYRPLAALATPAFWVFAIGSALYNFVIAGVTLFSESILAEHGFDQSVFTLAMGAFMAFGLVGNLLAGWLARRHPLGRLMAVAMLLVAFSLAALPFMAAVWQAILILGGLGFSGGVVTVMFFSAFAQLFGRAHLGKIQGVAQVFAVLASASGPWVLARVQVTGGSYDPAFLALAPLLAVAALAAWWVPLPAPPASETTAMTE